MIAEQRKICHCDRLGCLRVVYFGRLKGFSTPYPFRHPCAKAMYAANLTLENNPVAMGHTIDVRLKSYAWLKPNATFESIAAVNV